ncbi:uncharacterized protein LOC131033974 [Cryptomeria japonica]|uniref:uncharacterized protein LOC131033974 n=1 Tax=Cryptomeria japonica TaxID=3369 RepID=UPI0027DA060F|nr:uncharacterized protein LOC131033974 [Cryptomeria japonica]
MEMELLLSIKPKFSLSSKTSTNLQLGIRWPCSRKTFSRALSMQHSLSKRVFRTYSVNPKQSITVSIAGITSISSIVLFLEDAYAADSMSSEIVQSASKAPQWLAPAVLAFPVVSYLLFNIYRDKINPDAKVTDWMYGLAAMVIVANLVTLVTLGVRLY